MPQRPKTGRRDTPKSRCHARAPDRRRFRRRLLEWYRRNGRDLPWRQTSDPYHILVSEVMLQQTQVDRVLPKYDEWLAKYPTLAALAAADESDVSRDLAPARLQHPPSPAARDRPGVGRPLRRDAPVRRSDAAVVQGHRRVHGRRRPQLRLRPARGHPRHQRRARALPRLRRTRRTEGARDAASALEHLADGAADAATSSTSTRRSWTSAPRSARRASPSACSARCATDCAAYPFNPDNERRRRERRCARRRRNGGHHRARRHASSSPDDRAACTWKGCGSFPAASARPDESLETCLRREIQRGAGPTRGSTTRSSQVSHAYPDRTVELHFFRCELLGEPQPAARAGDALGRRGTGSPTSQFPPADAELIELLREGGGG